VKLDGKVIRMCLSEDCGIIYLDSGANLTYVKPCKKKNCEHATGFFEDMNHFYKHIDAYGIDTDNILDVELRKEVCQHYGLEG